MRGSEVSSRSDVNSCNANNNNSNRTQKFLDADSGPGTMLTALPHLILSRLYGAATIISISVLQLRKLRLRGSKLAQVT